MIGYILIALSLILTPMVYFRPMYSNILVDYSSTRWRIRNGYLCGSMRIVHCSRLILKHTIGLLVHFVILMFLFGVTYSSFLMAVGIVKSSEVIDTITITDYHASDIDPTGGTVLITDHKSNSIFKVNLRSDVPYILGYTNKLTLCKVKNINRQIFLTSEESRTWYIYKFGYAAE